jgi:hypothetical protein
MKVEIVEAPIRFCLYGKSSVVSGNAYGEVGLKLMNEMWNVVKQNHIANSGINHWVYLPEDRMFVGVELLQDAPPPGELEPLQFELPRYLKHVHIGPYQALPEKWKLLKAELTARGEEISFPSLEVYGHHCEDSKALETTILMGLRPGHADDPPLDQDASREEN